MRQEISIGEIFAIDRERVESFEGRAEFERDEINPANAGSRPRRGVPRSGKPLVYVKPFRRTVEISFIENG